SGALRSRRSVSPNEPAPVPFAEWSTNEFHASCHQRQRLLELVEARRFSVFATCTLLGLLNSCQRSRTKSAGPPARTTDAARPATTTAASSAATARTAPRLTARLTT